MDRANLTSDVISVLCCDIVAASIDNSIVRIGIRAKKGNHRENGTIVQRQNSP